jgi:AraC family transcriptional regulator
MNSVLEYMDSHLDQELDLRTLARVAHFSAYHFHRVFLSWTGETLGDYRRRRRVEIAAVRLAGQPRLSVLEVAVAVGFGSTAAFARAFKARFGRSASAWRAAIAQQRKPGLALRNPGQIVGTPGHDNASTVLTGAAMKVKVIERKPVKLACLRHVGPYGRPLSEFWQRTVYPWMAANDQLGQPRYGISLDDPTITAAAQCRYDAGVEVRGKLTVPGDSQSRTIPGGRYAVTAFRGTVDQIGGVWDALLRQWLPDSGLQLDARPFLEYYASDASFDAETGVFSCELAIPVAPL